jgi:hypothetical protein
VRKVIGAMSSGCIAVLVRLEEAPANCACARLASFSGALPAIALEADTLSAHEVAPALPCRFIALLPAPRDLEARRGLEIEVAAAAAPLRLENLHLVDLVDCQPLPPRHSRALLAASTGQRDCRSFRSVQTAQIDREGTVDEDLRGMPQLARAWQRTDSQSLSACA